MPKATSLDPILQLQALALGRRLKPNKIFRRTILRQVDGRRYSEIVRRMSPPDRYRDDLSVDGAWRFSESFDGKRAWYSDKRHSHPAEATGRALAAYRWRAARLDYLQPLKHLKRLGCGLKDSGNQSTLRGQRANAVQVSMLDYAETVFIDDTGLIVAHHCDLPEAGEEERELEVCIDEWGLRDGLVHPVRSTVLDRNTAETVAEIIVTSASFEPYLADVFTLSAD